MNFLMRRLITNHKCFKSCLSRTNLVSPYKLTASIHSLKECVQLRTVCENRPLASRVLCQHKICTKNIGFRTFHTTSRNQLPAIVWVVLRPIGKVFAVLVGRRLRIWWKNLPENKREVFREWFYKNKTRLALYLSSIIALVYVYYYTHLQETPLTGRRRFIAFTDKQYTQIAELEYKAHLAQFGDHFLPKSHPACRKIEHIAHRLLEANKDIKQIYDKNWSVCVVDAPNVKNAFVLPTGQIFVFTGMLNCVSNDDQLGIVLAHEMSHAILGHGAELLSFAHFLDIFVISALCLLWAIIPVDSSALVISWLYQKIMDVALQLPYNRMLETEADLIGLQLAAKACLDVREAVVFWRKMSLTEKSEIEAVFGDVGEMPQIEFLSTHPSHDKRAENIESVLEKALETRDACKCPRLPKIDPRVLFEKQKRRLSEMLENTNVIALRVPKRPSDV